MRAPDFYFPVTVSNQNINIKRDALNNNNSQTLLPIPRFIADEYQRGGDTVSTE